MLTRCEHCGAELEPGAAACPACDRPVGDHLGGTTDLPTIDPSPSPRETSTGHGRFLPGSMIGRRYRVVGLLGRGGMGEVYRCDDLELGQSVALKLLPEKAAQDPRWIDRLRSEVRTARQIAHPNVCRVYDIGAADGHVFLTMEYVDGGDLAQTLRRLGRPSSEKAVEIARQLCLALGSAHEHGVLHRDLKPANVMLDGRGRVRLTDFGLAGLAEELAGTREIAGTPAYMAPEQLESGEVSVRSDIYALGLILYELFTGRPAFTGDSLDEIRRSRTSGSVPSMTSSAAAVDPAVERVVLRCLEADPEERPASVYAVLGALPGADPLAAALAAGETPSPALVAGARSRGGLAPAWVAVALALCVAGVLVAAKTNSLRTVMPAERPDELAARVVVVAEMLGFDDRPQAAGGGFTPDRRLQAWIEEAALDPEAIAALPVSPYLYWRRFSPERLAAPDFHAPEFLGPTSPRPSVPGEMLFEVDDRGNLVRLLAVPSDDSQEPEVDDALWTTVLGLAGFEPEDLVPAELVGEVPDVCDRTVAWRAETPPLDIVLQGGSHRGRLVYFERFVDQALPPADEGGGPPALVPFFIWTVAILFAWRNLWLGRSDRRGAFRCALAVMVAYGVVELLADKTQSGGLLDFLGGAIWGRAGGHILIHGFNVWIVYIAVEPYVRKMWPRMLVGWVRLLSGSGRDPEVGRELLLGAAVGSVMISAFRYLPAMLDPGHINPLFQAGSLRILNGELWGLISIAYAVANVLLGMLFFVIPLLVIRLVVRKPRVTEAVAVVLLLVVALVSQGGPQGQDLPLPLRVSVYLVYALLLVGVYTRIGLLGAAVSMLVVGMLANPITTDVDAWYGGVSSVLAVLTLAPALWGAWACLAGTSFMERFLTGDD